MTDLGPRLLPATRSDRAHPDAVRRWSAWQREPLPDHRTWYSLGGEDGDAWGAIESFRALTGLSAFTPVNCR